ncbi:aa3-type cytochrome oxidase subunit CtaJ [Mycolicibacterium thermoresistibile]
MSIAEYALYLVGLPGLLVAVLAVLIWRPGRRRPASYKLSEPWTRDPILWASDEPAVPEHGGHGDTPVTIGGGASGKW